MVCDAFYSLLSEIISDCQWTASYCYLYANISEVSIVYVCSMKCKCSSGESILKTCSINATASQIAKLMVLNSSQTDKGGTEEICPYIFYSSKHVQVINRDLSNQAKFGVADKHTTITEDKNEQRCDIDSIFYWIEFHLLSKGQKFSKLTQVTLVPHVPRLY